MFKLSLLLAATAFAFSAAASHAKETPKFRVAWTIYAGSMPLGYAEDNGILDKWSKRYGIDVEAVQLNDYIEAQNQYTAGEFDGVIAITLDALTIPAAGGVDSSVVVLLSASNGSDGVVVKGKNKSVKDLQGQKVNLVEFSGSHYLLARALDKHGMSERDLTVVNTSDADIIAAFQARESQAVVTWKPQLSQVLQQNPDATLVFDSSDIPNEITDVLLVKTETLAKYPQLGKVLAGAWYEAVSLLDPNHPQHKPAVEEMAKAVGTDAAGFLSQTDTIHVFKPAEARTLIESEAFHNTLKATTQFAWDKGLLGEGAKGPEHVGVSLGDSRTIGNSNNVKLRFPVTYVQQAAQ